MNSYETHFSKGLTFNLIKPNISYMWSAKIFIFLSIKQFPFSYWPDYRPSKQALPFLPKSPKCLKPGQLAKVIAKSGRVVVGRIRYVGPLAREGENSDETYIGLQLQNNLGDSDGTVEGRKFFDW